jgi:hypothetical protein
LLANLPKDLPERESGPSVGLSAQYYKKAGPTCGESAGVPSSIFNTTPGIFVNKKMDGGGRFPVRGRSGQSRNRSPRLSPRVKMITRSPVLVLMSV